VNSVSLGFLFFLVCGNWDCDLGKDLFILFYLFIVWK
jgi:hypothetical protein